MRCTSAYRWFALSTLIVLLDQLTKYCASRYLSGSQVVHVFPFLNFILRFNEGAAFSFLSLQNGWQVYLLSGISIAVSIGLIIWICRLSQSAWVTALSLSLILGGAIGNLIDRLRFGFVVDFVDFHVKNWHFATFNVADSAVSVGVILLVLRVCYESVTGKP